VRGRPPAQSFRNDVLPLSRAMNTAPIASFGVQALGLRRCQPGSARMGAGSRLLGPVVTAALVSCLRRATWSPSPEPPRRRRLPATIRLLRDTLALQHCRTIRRPAPLRGALNPRGAGQLKRDAELAPLAPLAGLSLHGFRPRASAGVQKCTAPGHEVVSCRTASWCAASLPDPVRINFPTQPRPHRWGFSWQLVASFL